MAVGEGGDGGCRVLEAASAPTPPMPPPPLETPPPEAILETALPGMLLVETLPPGMLPPGMLLRAKTLPRREMLEMAVGEGGDGGCRVLRARLGMGRCRLLPT